MKTERELYILTGDRDLGDEMPYEGVAADTWVNRNGVNVYYASPGKLSWGYLRRLIKEVGAEYIYLNSMYSRYFTIYPLAMKKIGSTGGTVILAPRGMLKATAMGFKSRKKNLFLLLLKLAGIGRVVHFHATDATEASDIRRFFGEKAELTQLSNFPGPQPELVLPPSKQAGVLKMIFVGRIHPVKNLLLLLQYLQEAESGVQLTIVGAVEDRAYWAACNKVIQSLPSCVTVTIAGETPHEAMQDLLRQHHLFCLPTQGENFGHAIVEALAAGRPVLISDQTPWKGLEQHQAGWDIPLQNQKKWIEQIQQVAQMDNTALQILCRAAWQYCRSFTGESDLLRQYLRLFSDTKTQAYATGN